MQSRCNFGKEIFSGSVAARWPSASEQRPRRDARSLVLLYVSRHARPFVKRKEQFKSPHFFRISAGFFLFGVLFRQALSNKGKIRPLASWTCLVTGLVTGQAAASWPSASEQRPQRTAPSLDVLYVAACLSFSSFSLGHCWRATQAPEHLVGSGATRGRLLKKKKTPRVSIFAGRPEICGMTRLNA